MEAAEFRSGPRPHASQIPLPNCAHRARLGQLIFLAQIFLLAQGSYRRRKVKYFLSRRVFSYFVSADLNEMTWFVFSDKFGSDFQKDTATGDTQCYQWITSDTRRMNIMKG